MGRDIMKSVVDNAAGPTGIIGILIAKIPSNPAEWLVFLSTSLVLCQFAHWLYRFFKWFKEKK